MELGSFVEFSFFLFVCYFLFPFFFSKEIKVSISFSLQLRIFFYFSFFLHGKKELFQLARACSVSLEVRSSPWWEM